MAKQAAAVLEETPKRKPVFCITDRCDLCHAEALMRAYLPITPNMKPFDDTVPLRKLGTVDLQLCGHHGKSSLPKLAILGAEIEWKVSDMVWT